MGLTSYNSIENAVRGCFGQDVTVVSGARFAHGDINSTKALVLSNGSRVLVKSNSIRNKAFFDAEEEGLLAIAATHTIGTPKLFCKGVDEDTGISFLMMDLIEEFDV